MPPIDLRSDTVTRPTPEMRRAMAECELGDDVAGDDPTVNRLQELAAEAMGKEDALFVPSGTMGNVIAAMVHAEAGSEVIVGRNNHMNIWEGAALARIAGVSKWPVETDRFGAYDLNAVGASLRNGGNVHCPRARLLCLESTHNDCGGTVPPLEFLRVAREFADGRGLRVHLDGARIFNAATYLGVEARMIAQHADSVMFCLSKGLCSPVGSLLCGARDFIDEARRCRKILGGGMRQAGVLAACGIISVEKMTKRLQEDHDNCRGLAEAVAEMPGLTVDIETVQTNILYFRVGGGAQAAKGLAAGLSDAGVLCHELLGRIRMVTHNDVSREEIHGAIEIIGKVASEQARSSGRSSF